MPSLHQRAIALDQKGLLPPRFLRWDFAPGSFREITNRAKDNEPVIQWIKELSDAQRPELWNVFVRSKGKLDFAAKDPEGVLPPYSSHYWSGIAKSKTDGRWKLSMELLYSTALHAQGYDNYDLFHELGHMIDDRMFLSGSKETTMGLHSDSKAWRWLVKLDQSVFPNGGAAQIIDNRREGNYLSTSPDWHAEIFAEAINWHMGPKRCKALYSIDYTEIRHRKAEYSPFLQAYMDTVVALDIAIQTQDKPYVECQKDRKKLQAVLAEPLVDCFDLEAMREQEARIKDSKIGAVKQVAIDAMRATVESGLQKMVAVAAAEIGIPVPVIGVRYR